MIGMLHWRLAETLHVWACGGLVLFDVTKQLHSYTMESLPRVAKVILKLRYFPRFFFSSLSSLCFFTVGSLLLPSGGTLTVVLSTFFFSQLSGK